MTFCKCGKLIGLKKYGCKCKTPVAFDEVSKKQKIGRYSGYSKSYMGFQKVFNKGEKY